MREAPFVRVTIGISGQEATTVLHSLDEVADAIQRTTDELVPDSEHGAIEVDRFITIVVEGPDSPCLTLIDLPGIIQTVDEGQDPGLIVGIKVRPTRRELRRPHPRGCATRDSHAAASRAPPPIPSRVRAALLRRPSGPRRAAHDLKAHHQPARAPVRARDGADRTRWLAWGSARPSRGRVRVRASGSDDRGDPRPRARARLALELRAQRRRGPRGQRGVSARAQARPRGLAHSRRPHVYVSRQHTPRSWHQTCCVLASTALLRKHLTVRPTPFAHRRAPRPAQTLIASKRRSGRACSRR